MEYIIRRCKDPSHVAVACISNGVVTAGALYRPHPAVPKPSDGAGGTTLTEAFAELVFLSVETSAQVGGLGTRLINRLKTTLTSQSIPRVLTYADNTALLFFQLQGFTHELTISADDYVGRIGEYKESVLMECVLHADIPYSRLPLMIRSARSAILAPWQAAPAHDTTPHGSTSTTSSPAQGLHHGTPTTAGTARFLAPSAPSPLPLQPLPSVHPLRLGQRLETALAIPGCTRRELNDERYQTTDHGAGLGARLVPLELGSMRLADPSTGVSAQLEEGFAQHRLPPGSGAASLPVDQALLAKTSGRRACDYYSDGPQVVADLHRLGLASKLLLDGTSLKNALRQTAA